MDILEENQKPFICPVTNKPEKMYVDWVCPNQDCAQGNTEKNGFSNFVDGGGVFTPATVKFSCGTCGTSETTMIYIDFKKESKGLSPY